METFSALLTLCVGNSPVTGEFRAQRPVTRSFDVFFELKINPPSSFEDLCASNTYQGQGQVITSHSISGK